MHTADSPAKKKGVKINTRKHLPLCRRGYFLSTIGRNMSEHGGGPPFLGCHLYICPVKKHLLVCFIASVNGTHKSLSHFFSASFFSSSKQCWPFSQKWIFPPRRPIRDWIWKRREAVASALPPPACLAFGMEALHDWRRRLERRRVKRLLLYVSHAWNNMAKINLGTHNRTICLMDFWKGMQVSKILEKVFCLVGKHLRPFNIRVSTWSLFFCISRQEWRRRKLRPPWAFNGNAKEPPSKLRIFSCVICDTKSMKS